MVIQRESDTRFSTLGFSHVALNISLGHSKIQGDIRFFVFLAGVNDTANKLFTCVNHIAGVVDTGNKTVATLSPCQHLKVNIK